MDCISSERLLTREQAARFCGTTVEFLMNCARRRKNGPPFYRYSNQTVLYRRDELSRMDGPLPRREPASHPIKNNPSTANAGAEYPTCYTIFIRDI